VLKRHGKNKCEMRNGISCSDDVIGTKIVSSPV
jgi:hypothetical protein